MRVRGGEEEERGKVRGMDPLATGPIYLSRVLSHALLRCTVEYTSTCLSKNPDARSLTVTRTAIYHHHRRRQ
jgi:hypothetical protein